MVLLHTALSGRDTVETAAGRRLGVFNGAPYIRLLCAESVSAGERALLSCHDPWLSGVEPGCYKTIKQTNTFFIILSIFSN